MDALIQQLNTFLRAEPKLGQGVYLASTAIVIGDVTMGDYSSAWYHAVLRGDINRIVIGKGTNIQDNAVVHVADEHPCILGDYVTVGHSAIVHACTLGNEVLVGMGAVVLDGAVVGDQCVIGANAVVVNGMQIPAGSMVLGTPAKIVRALSSDERSNLKHWAEKYVVNAAYCLKHGINVGTPLKS